jgi:hypothetical protein
MRNPGRVRINPIGKHDHGQFVIHTF